jgi:predicted nucleic acid-binding protein
VSRFILDASIVLTWYFPDEEAQKALEISERIAVGDRVIVPAFWRHEILNALLVGERRKRLTPELTEHFLEDLDECRSMWICRQAGSSSSIRHKLCAASPV